MKDEKKIIILFIVAGIFALAALMAAGVRLLPMAIVFAGFITSGLIAFRFFFKIRLENERLCSERESLEAEISKCTAELQESNERLQAELSERKRIEGELWEAVIRIENEKAKTELEREKLRLLYDNSPDAVIIVDTNKEIVYANRKTEALVGKPAAELKGRLCYEAVTGCNTICAGCRMHEAAQMKTPLTNIKHDVACSGKESWLHQLWYPIFNADGGIDSVVEISRDITELKRMEEEFLKVRKIESIGVLAGGIAHDFNNLLTGIMGCLSLAKDIVKPEDKIYEILTVAQRASRQAKDLTYQLLTFSKGGEPIRRLTPLGELLKEAAGFAMSGSNVKIDFYITDGLWNVSIDTEQIRQVIHNLVINARDAMPEGGTVIIRAENTMVGHADKLPVGGGEYVKISITDQGGGISEENMQKIFDPYFTTKQMGTQKGMGLGLAICYSIMKNHDGFITVDSEVGAGTTFTLYLPASPDDMPSAAEKRELTVPAAGKILVMDDEEIIGEIAKMMFNRMGYEVVFSRDGNEALERYRKAKESGMPFDAVIMDLTVPGGMGGKSAIKKLLEIDPDATAIVSSGYSNDPIMSTFRKYGFKGVLSKPYEINELRAVISKVLKDGK